MALQVNSVPLNITKIQSTEQKSETTISRRVSRAVSNGYN